MFRSVLTRTMRTRSPSCCRPLSPSSAEGSRLMPKKDSKGWRSRIFKIKDNRSVNCYNYYSHYSCYIFTLTSYLCNKEIVVLSIYCQIFFGIAILVSYMIIYIIIKKTKLYLCCFVGLLSGSESWSCEGMEPCTTPRMTSRASCSLLYLLSGGNRMHCLSVCVYVFPACLLESVVNHIKPVDFWYPFSNLSPEGQSPSINE